MGVSSNTTAGLRNGTVVVSSHHGAAPPPPLHQLSACIQKSEGNIYRNQMIAVSIVAAVTVTMAAVVVGWRVITCVREEDLKKRRNSVPCPQDAHEVFEALLDQQYYRSVSPANSVMNSLHTIHGIGSMAGSMAEMRTSSVRARHSVTQPSVSSKHSCGLYYYGDKNGGNKTGDEGGGAASEGGRSANGYESVAMRLGRRGTQHDDIEEDAEFGDESSTNYEGINGVHGNGTCSNSSNGVGVRASRNRLSAKQRRKMTAVAKKTHSEVIDETLNGDDGGAQEKVSDDDDDDDGNGEASPLNDDVRLRQPKMTSGYKPVYN